VSGPSDPPGAPDPNASIEEDVAGAWRPRGPGGGARFHPGWYDLDEAARLRAFDAASANRAIEAALDPAGLSSTGRAVLRRIR
jgi:hypothetical protein